MQKLVERFPVKGIFKMTVRKNGKVIEEYEDHNLIVNGARNQAARMFAGDVTGRPIKSIAFGTKGTAPVVTDKAITGAYTKDVEGFSFPEQMRTTEWQSWSLVFCLLMERSFAVKFVRIRFTRKRT